MNKIFAGVVLAGGKSSRMGQNKAFLQYQGKTLLQHAAAALEIAGATEIWISGEKLSPYPTLHDVFTESGPMAGLHSACLHTSCDHILILAVDMPQMSGRFLKSMFMRCTEKAGIICQNEDHFEPLAAFYPKSIMPLLEQHLRNQQTKLQNFVSTAIQVGLLFPYSLKGEEKSFFTNWNYPQDVE